MPDAERVLRLAHSDLELAFVRSSGPGGQNVNKVATAAQLRFDVLGASFLGEAARNRLMRLAGRRMTSDGILMIEAKRYRTQEQNRTDALSRFDDLLRRALEEPKHRVPTKASAGSREKRLQSKKKKSETKRNRRSGPFEL